MSFIYLYKQNRETFLIWSANVRINNESKSFDYEIQLRSAQFQKQIKSEIHVRIILFEVPYMNIEEEK